MALIKLPQPTIRYDDGTPVILNAAEKYHAEQTQKIFNSRFANTIGYEVSITTLTGIQKKISAQKFYEVAPADYIPMRVGENSFASNLEIFRSYSVSSEFEKGIINTGGNYDRLASSDAAIDALNIKVNNWAKSLSYSVFELEQAARFGNWDIVSAKERARKQDWDLGIQKVAFLGAQGQNGSLGQCLGLFNQVGITLNTTLITQSISTMTYTQLATLQQGLVQAFRANCNYTRMPNRFVIPELDYNGLAAQSSPQFPIKSYLELLEEGFKVICRDPSFKILPSAYATVAQAGSGILPSGIATQIYALYRYDDESMVMNIPVDYTPTLQNTINGFQFSSAAFAQFTGLLQIRNLELLYLGF